MKKVSLQFLSILQLIDFTLAIDSNFCQMNKTTLVLTCELSEKEINLATSGYEAIVV
ncbi:MAG: hypothetical protein M3352_02530 [Bacteroidota bacterium]|nr:hypothetical protein [Bacteroidota bacterium]